MKQRGMKRVGATILSSNAVLLGITFTMLFIFSGVGLCAVPKYLEPWRKNYAAKFDDPRIRLIAHGLLASNSHNMQPWKIRLDQENRNIFYLYADSTRLTKEVDPFNRQIMISQGTFLEYVKVAGEKIGYKTEIILFPDGEYDEQNLNESMQRKAVAKIIIAKDKPQNSRIYDFMYLADTNRAAYKANKLTAEQLKKLQNINEYSEMTIKIFQDQENLNRIGKYAMKAAEIEVGIPRINAETAKLIRLNEGEKEKYRYGFSLEGQGKTGITKHIMQTMITLFPSLNNEKSSADMFIKSTKNSVDHTPAYTMIITKGNSRKEQVKTGMFYSRMILNAHAMGFVLQPLCQVLQEYPEMEKQYSSIHRNYATQGGTIQMLCRLGKPTKKYPLSMRRDVMDLIDFH